MITTDSITRQDQNKYAIQDAEEANFYLSLIQLFCKHNDVSLICYHNNALDKQHWDDISEYDFRVFFAQNIKNFIFEAEENKRSKCAPKKSKIIKYFYLPLDQHIPKSFNLPLTKEQSQTGFNIDLNKNIREYVPEEIYNFLITKCFCSNEHIYHSVIKLTIKEMIKIVCDYKTNEITLITTNNIYNTKEFKEILQSLNATLCYYDVRQSQPDEYYYPQKKFLIYNTETKRWDKKLTCSCCNCELNKENKKYHTFYYTESAKCDNCYDKTICCNTCGKQMNSKNRSKFTYLPGTASYQCDSCYNNEKTKRDLVWKFIKLKRKSYKYYNAFLDKKNAEKAEKMTIQELRKNIKSLLI